MKNIILFIAIFCSISAYSQHSLIFKVVDSAQTPLPGAVVSFKRTSLSTDANGQAMIQNIPAGAQTFTVSHVGFAVNEITISIPSADNIITVIMTRSEEDL